jgi:hypothetical protein
MGSGKIVGGKVSEVGLDLTGEGELGDQLSISLVEPPQSFVSWWLDVDVTTREGRFRIGRVKVPSALSQQIASTSNTLHTGGASPCSRHVAEAFFPGARSWHVIASVAEIFPIQPAPPGHAEKGLSRQAELVLATRMVGSGFPGVTPVIPTGIGAGTPERPFVLHEDFGHITVTAAATLIGAAAMTAPLGTLSPGENPTRLRMRVRNIGATLGPPVFLGSSAGVTPASGWPIYPAVDTADFFEIIHSRPIWGITGGANIDVAVYEESS